MALNPWQRAIEDLAKSMGLKGQAQQGVYQSPQFQSLINSFFGNIQLPAGIDESMVVSRTPTSVEYRDAQGYIHRLERDINGTSARLGEVKEASTNRPSILPLDQSNTPAAPTAQQQTNLTQTLTNTLANPVELAKLDPETQAMLNQIFQSQNALQEDAFQKAQGTSVAQLVGNGVGASSIAGQIMNELLKGQALARGQQQANQNETQLGVQQYLTGANQQNTQMLQQFIQYLLQLGTQRDISSGEQDISKMQVGNQNDQFYRTLQEQMRQFDEQMRMQERQALIGNIFKGIAAATGVASGASSTFGGASSLPKGGGAITPPYIPIPQAPANNGSLFGRI